MLDAQEMLFTITDLKQYIYCPRIFYYHACLPNIRPITYKMQAGIDTHESERRRALRRSFTMYEEPAGKRYFAVNVQSAELGLSGQIDEVVETEQGELMPVDYKLARQVGHHFKVQLAAYAMLLETANQTKVKAGFLYLLLSRKTIRVPVTSKLREEVVSALAMMRMIVGTEVMPEPTQWRQRCSDCEFRRFCNDV
jgi:CRISPR-associated exonuclease Cas4